MPFICKSRSNLWQLKTLEIGHRLPRQAGDLRSLKDETVCGELSPHLSGRGHWSISTGRLRCYRWLTRSNHPAEAKEFARQELASEMKRDFSAEALEQSWGRLHFVSEISREPFDHFLSDAQKVGFLRGSVDLSHLVEVP